MTSKGGRVPKVHVRPHLRRRESRQSRLGVGLPEPSVPPVPRGREPRPRDPLTGKFLSPGEKPKEDWQYAEELLERETQKADGDTIAGMWRAQEFANERGLTKILVALEGMQEDDRAEPKATFVYSDDEDEDGDPTDVKTVGAYYDDTDGDFVVEWHRTDPWRGYYEVEAADKNEWVKVHDDNILAGSADSEALAGFDKLVRAAMRQAGIRYVRVTAVSSNLFSVGYDLFVEADQAERVESLVNILAPIYRDPSRYYATALTGKDPEDLTESDVAFLNVAAIALSKEPVENKREMLREHFEKAGFDPKLADQFMDV